MFYTQLSVEVALLAMNDNRLVYAFHWSIVSHEKVTWPSRADFLVSASLQSFTLLAIQRAVLWRLHVIYLYRADM